MDKPDPLLEWNRLNVANAERELVSAFFLGLLASSEPLDRFSSWLLAGAGATAALFITNVSSILPFLSEAGYRHCGSMLVISGLFGLLAKQRALQVRISLEQRRILEDKMIPVLDEHEKEEDQIREAAEKRGLVLETDVDFVRTVSTFISAFPKFMHRYLFRKALQGLNEPHSSQKDASRGLLHQVLFTSCQSFFFLLFICLGILHASAI